jgi:hypothetical protein
VQLQEHFRRKSVPPESGRLHLEDPFQVSQMKTVHLRASHWTFGSGSRLYFWIDSR